ncbi:hypothetical protein D9613_003986 [Agrocybe pediades]|uniref:DNA2/NAM7 helicase-like C-terminal domain-containing protein n=1 Tax=Agrocybe pediades TaxID=84607 RepID=A0A8H4QIQ4_9AGAR|nr:hypothetical protein D9613_003986 [Agrocybe pediades]
MERILRGSRIILCTLSMLSNPALQDNGTFDIVPVDKLVIDEASQISTYDFLHLFVKFQQTLGKVCFFGDPKQLPPYGKDNIPTMKTIFDVQHIPSQSFLDTQYRMPAAVGNFISTAVYSGRLKSARPLEDNTCLAFVNVDLPRGEEEKVGFSWKNTGEIQTIVHLVKNYYKDKKFTVITPYDAQRAAIQQALQSEKLPWESVYNIDSFQGNEDDYVLISVVRSQHPGFLSSLNRLNVMLTRFKKGMVIVSSQRFMKLGGSQTLLGGLSREWQSKCSGNTWIDWRDVAGRQANLPGSSGVHGASRNLAFGWGYQHPVSHTPGTVYPQPVPFWYQGTSGGFDTSKLFPQRPRQPQNLNLQPRPSMVTQAPAQTISPSTSIVRSNATFATIAAAPPKPPSHDGFIQVKRGAAPRSYQQDFVSRSSHASSANKFSPLRGQQKAALPQSRQRDSTVQKANNALFTNKFSPIQGRWNTGPPALSNIRKKSSHSYAF